MATAPLFYSKTFTFYNVNMAIPSTIFSHKGVENTLLVTVSIVRYPFTFASYGVMRGSTFPTSNRLNGSTTTAEPVYAF